MRCRYYAIYACLINTPPELTLIFLYAAATPPLSRHYADAAAITAVRSIIFFADCRRCCYFMPHCRHDAYRRRRYLMAEDS